MGTAFLPTAAGSSFTMVSSAIEIAGNEKQNKDMSDNSKM
jgi:hypothetical protein